MGGFWKPRRRQLVRRFFVLALAVSPNVLAAGAGEPLAESVRGQATVAVVVVEGEGSAPSERQFYAVLPDGRWFRLSSGESGSPLSPGQVITLSGRAVDGVLEPGGLDVVAGAASACNSYDTLGDQKLVVIPFRFEDEPPENPPVSPAEGEAFFATVAQWFEQASYGKSRLVPGGLGPAGEQRYVLGEAPFVIPRDSWLPGIVARLLAIPAVADAADFTDVDRLLVVHRQAKASNAVFGKVGVPTPDGDGCLGVAEITSWSRAGLVAQPYGIRRSMLHELGHTYGLDHANHLSSVGGFEVEYGNYNDVMGAGGLGHYNALAKHWLGWLAAEEAVTVGPSGTYVLRPLEASGPGLKAIRILRQPQPPFDPYWYFEYRQPIGSGAASIWNENDGAQVNAGTFRLPPSYPSKTTLLDMTPETPSDEAVDDALLVGRTWADARRGVFVTPTAKDAGSLTLRVNFASDSPGNRPPTIVAVATKTQALPSGQLLADFQAEAVDSDGDELAYFWRMDVGGGRTYPANQPFYAPGTYGSGRSISKVFADGAARRVWLVVSDMKGGEVARPVDLFGYQNHAPSIAATVVFKRTIGFQTGWWFAINVKDADKDLLTYDWDFGDGTHSTYPSPFHFYQGSSGIYDVKVSVSDGEYQALGQVTVDLSTPPPNPKLIAPSGVVGTSNPSYTWIPVAGAESYYLGVWGPGNTNPIARSYSAADVCSGGTCTVTPTRALANANYSCWVQAMFFTGDGIWSNRLDFTVAATPTAATPAISPNGGSFSGAVPVTLGTTTAGATIRHTTNGSDPTAASTAYAGPFTLTTSATVKARAFKAGYHDCSVAAASFTITTPTAATPAISPSGGTFSGAVPVTLGTTTAGATIRYTTNGSDPTATSTAYSGPFTLTASATVKARAFKAGYNDSGVAAAAFTVTPSNQVDLVATALSWSPNPARQGEAVSVTFVVTNTGGQGAGQFHVQLKRDGSPMCDWTVWSLEPGQVFQRTCSGSYGIPSATMPGHTISIAVDDQGDVSEASEGNNALSVFVPVQ